MTIMSSTLSFLLLVKCVSLPFAISSHARPCVRTHTICFYLAGLDGLCWMRMRSIQHQSLPFAALSSHFILVDVFFVAGMAGFGSHCSCHSSSMFCGVLSAFD
mmetsp:Transcript_64690/g.140471  ORF Transcript_64690/g.140471 Transcript_64690/m.140471 type:complete len:103 (+) Transcript_64690:134-442(+)